MLQLRSCASRPIIGEELVVVNVVVAVVVVIVEVSQHNSCGTVKVAAALGTVEVVVLQFKSSTWHVFVTYPEEHGARRTVMQYAIPEARYPFFV